MERRLGRSRPTRLGAWLRQERRRRRLVLEPEAAIPPPTIEVYRRRVDFTGTVLVMDHDATGHEFGEFDMDGSFCEVSPLERDVRVKLPATRTCKEEVRAFDVRNSDEGGDRVEVNVSFRNVRGTLIENLPNVQPENLRRLTFSGEVDVVDDDTFDSDERQTFLFSQECLVDPFDREDSFSFSACAGAEVNVKINVDCRLALDNQSVDVSVRTRPLEGTTCLSDDEDGRQNRNFLVNPCGGSCGPTPLVFTVSNTDEGGDRADINVQIVNEQR